MESLIDIYLTINEPLIVGWGDFNVFTRNEEKLGGLLVTLADTTDFKYCISLCDLEDPRFKGSKFTS